MDIFITICTYLKKNVFLSSVKDSRITQYFELTYFKKFLTIARATFATVWIRACISYKTAKIWNTWPIDLKNTVLTIHDFKKIY